MGIRRSLFCAGVLAGAAILPIAGQAQVTGTPRATPTVRGVTTLGATGGAAAYGDRRITGRSDVHVSDQAGVDVSGASNSLAAVNAALALAISQGGTLVMDPGTYAMSGLANGASNLSYEFDHALFPSNSLAGLADGTPVQAPLTHAWARANVTDQGNSFTTFTSLSIGATSSPAGYEKAAGYDAVLTYDPSVYSGSGSSYTGVTTRDAVGRQMSATIAYGISLGRAWGGVSGCYATGDGYCVGHEFDLTNNATDQPLQDQPTSKTGVLVVAMGSANSTSAIHIEANAGVQWHDGVVVRQAAVLGKALRVIASGSLTADTWSVLPTGDETANSLTLSTGSLTSATTALLLKTAGGTQFAAYNIASAVNYLAANGSVTGVAPSIVAAGSDANIGITLTTKGAGNIQLGSGAAVTNAGLLYLSGLVANNTAGVACSGAPTASFATVGGVVTHC